MIKSNKYTFEIHKTEIKEGCWKICDVAVLENGQKKGEFRYPYPSLQQICWFEFKAFDDIDYIINLTDYCGQLRIIKDSDFSEFKKIDLNPHFCPLFAHQINKEFILFGGVYWGVERETYLFILDTKTWEISSKAINDDRADDIDIDSIVSYFDEEDGLLELEYKCNTMCFFSIKNIFNKDVVNEC